MTNRRDIQVISPGAFTQETAQTLGSVRLAGVCAETGVDSALWGGTFEVAPGARTGIHHHGTQETIAYVLEGESLVEWGEHGEFQRLARAGDFIHVPAWLLHRESNPSATQAFRWVVIRSTPEPIVVALPDSTWR
jgi:uncharacterized RmlC-like cupin family protein